MTDNPDSPVLESSDSVQHVDSFEENRTPRAQAIVRPTNPTANPSPPVMGQVIHSRANNYLGNAATKIQARRSSTLHNLYTGGDPFVYPTDNQSFGNVAPDPGPIQPTVPKEPKGNVFQPVASTCKHLYESAITVNSHKTFNFTHRIPAVAPPSSQNNLKSYATPRLRSTAPADAHAHAIAFPIRPARSSSSPSPSPSHSHPSYKSSDYYPDSSRHPTPFLFRPATTPVETSLRSQPHFSQNQNFVSRNLPRGHNDTYSQPRLLRDEQRGQICHQLHQNQAQEHYRQPKKQAHIPRTKGQVNGSIVRDDYHVLPIVPPKPARTSIKLPSPSLNSRSTQTGDILAPYDNPHPVKLRSRPIPGSFPLRSKPVFPDKDKDPSPELINLTTTSISDTPASPKNRHPAIISSANEHLPGIPRKSRGLNPANATLAHSTVNASIQSSVSSKSSSHSSVECTDIPTISVENSDVKHVLSQSISVQKQTEDIAHEPPVKVEDLNRAVTKRHKCSQVFDVDSHQAGNERAELTECGGGGNGNCVQTRARAALQVTGSAKRLKTESSKKQFKNETKITGEAWMNIRSNEDQFMRAVSIALDEHPNLFTLSHFALVDGNLRDILEKSPFRDSNNTDRAFELDNNNIVQVTSNVCRLLAEYRVDRLNLAFNNIRELNGDISLCGRLRFLNLARNSLSQLPGSLCTLSALETLNVSHNDLRSLPEGMHRLKKLRILSAAHNKLKGLPEDMVGFGSVLFGLDISYNESIASLPACLNFCKELANLELNGTCLRDNLRPKDMSNVRVLVRLIAGIGSDGGAKPTTSSSERVQGKETVPPRVKAGKAALEREESRKCAKIAQEKNEVLEVHDVDNG